MTFVMDIGMFEKKKKGIFLSFDFVNSPGTKRTLTLHDHAGSMHFYDILSLNPTPC